MSPQALFYVWSLGMHPGPSKVERESHLPGISVVPAGCVCYVLARCLAPDAPTLIVLDKRTGRFLARDTAPTVVNMLHGQWSSPSMGTVNGRKLVFLGGGDGNCYAFEALAGVPENPVTLKTAWWVGFAAIYRATRRTQAPGL